MLALLHTSPAHVPVFDDLRDEDHQGLELRHFVDEELLARARREVAATLESTLGPTVALVEEEGRRIGRPVAVRTLLVEGAWARFEVGDTEGCARLVADAVDAVGDADAIVLAQGSMAGAQQLTMTPIPVLSSPRLGLAAGAWAVRVG
ncbi:hypothetical protein [Streptomyces sp. MBT53]|uniref:hypothetical protein n=1 Tax=Streptomyces sp. MBT53 TaxID=1488384 RepID=UPI001911A343|nr:hypothetical protein [Streptomyces sp. MBT53]MBK6010365.1 hypothetical protein [Streptomyces sp. MBT53]